MGWSEVGVSESSDKCCCSRCLITDRVEGSFCRCQCGGWCWWTLMVLEGGGWPNMLGKGVGWSWGWSEVVEGGGNEKLYMLFSVL